MNAGNETNLKYKKKFIIPIFIIFLVIFSTTAEGILKSEKKINSEPNELFLKKTSHLIYGTATYYENGDYIPANGATVYVISNYSTLTTVVYNQGNWYVDCGDPTTNWSDQTEFNVYVIGCCAHNGWYGNTSGIVSGEYNDMGNILVYPNIKPNTPIITSDAKIIKVNTTGIYSTFATDPNIFDNIKYRFDWDAEGSHDYSSFTSYLIQGTQVNITKKWIKTGTYIVKSQAWDENGGKSKWSDGLTIIIYGDNNKPPEKPIITGPKSGIINKEYIFNISSSDKNNDNIFYFIKWGDNSSENWIGPYKSNEKINVSHIWKEIGKYQIEIKARDIYEIESNWSDPFNVTINEPIVIIDEISGGLLKINAVIKNIGDGNATNLNWSINPKGKWIIFGEKTFGTIENISPGEKIIIKSDMIIGIGRISVEVNTSLYYGKSDTKELDAIIFLFYILI